MKRKDDKLIRNLDVEIKFHQADNYANKIYSSIKKENKVTIKKVLLTFIPSTLLIASGLIFNITPLIFAGVGVVCVGTAAETISHFINEMNLIDDKPKKKKYDIEPEEDLDLDQTIYNGLGEESHKSFYNEKYESNLKKIKDSTDVEETKKPSLKIVDDKKEPEFLNKEETMIQISKEIDAFYYAYKLPPLKIKENEWNDFFDYMHEIYSIKNLEAHFYENTSSLLRNVFAMSLLNKTQSINISTFVNNLQYICQSEFTPENISTMQKELTEKLQASKVVNFNR